MHSASRRCEQVSGVKFPRLWGALYLDHLGESLTHSCSSGVTFSSQGSPNFSDCVTNSRKFFNPFFESFVDNFELWGYHPLVRPDKKVSAFTEQRGRLYSRDEK